MGAKWCCFRPAKVESHHNSELTLADIVIQDPELNEMTMEETRDVAGPSEQKPPTPTSRPSEAVEILDSVTLRSQGESSNTNESSRILDSVTLRSQGESSNTNDASRILDSVTLRSQGESSNTNESSRILDSVTLRSQGESSNTNESSRILDSVTLRSQGESSNTNEASQNLGEDGYRASNILWITGSFSDPIPNGFYSLIRDNRVQIFNSIPTLDELNALGDKDLKAGVILVDFEKDEKLERLKQLVIRLARGWNNLVVAIKNIAQLVSKIYNEQNRLSPTKSFGSLDFPLLGQIKQDSCRVRALLFKVLADTVGIESRIIVGFPSLRSSASMDSYSHMSVAIVVYSVETLVDLKRNPGQLIPLSADEISIAHNSAAGNNSCCSPLKPNSPMYSSEKDEKTQAHRKLKQPSLPSVVQSSLSLSRTEPNLATELLPRSQGKVIEEQHTASSSSEKDEKTQAHRELKQSGLPSVVQSSLSSSRSEPNLATEFLPHSQGKVIEEQHTASSSPESEGTEKLETKRIMRRHSTIPEISDDYVRKVREMKEALKQSRPPKQGGDDDSSPHSLGDRTKSPHLQKSVSCFPIDSHGQVSGEGSMLDLQKAISLPSSPQNYQIGSFEKSEPSHENINQILNEVLESPMFKNKPLLPYAEWIIDFSELKVGTSVSGIGSFGVVSRGIWKGIDVAVKMLIDQDLTAEKIKLFCNEISIISRLRHPNVILFLGACIEPPRLSMVTELLERGSLYSVLHSTQFKKKLSCWKRKLKIMREICRGLMCIHRMGVVHLDLKSANCLLNKTWTVKICDFGLSRMIKDTTMNDTRAVETPEWMAPELIRKEPSSVKCDIFSFGVIMWEICTLSKPWEGVPIEEVTHIVANEGARLEIPEGQPVPIGKLIADCWSEPELRPSSGEIMTRLKHFEDLLD